MEGESSELQGWEVLNHGSGSAMIRSDLEEKEEAAMEGDSEGMIRADYFSIESRERYGKTVSEVELSDGSVESDNPSWVDPGTENRYGRKIPGEFWSDSGSDRSDELKISDSEAKHELGTVGVVEMESGVGVDGIGDEYGASDANSGMLEPGESIYSCLVAKSEPGFERFGEMMNQERGLDRFWSDSNDVMVSMKLGDVSQLSEMGGDGLGHSVELEGENSSKMESGEGYEHSSDNKESEDGAIVEMKPSAQPVDAAGDERRVVWWKVPLEFLRHCAFRVSPAWSLSVAAALMGFIILSRRLSRMKRKAQSLQLKVTVDEKKVSLFKSRAARLNEVFSVVRRVPITRPSHPAAGLASWPMMSLR